MTTFRDWLQDEMNKRDISQAELSRLTGITPAQISRIMSDSRGVGEKTIRSIADGLRIPIDEVFRAAGLLPPNKKRIFGFCD